MKHIAVIAIGALVLGLCPAGAHAQGAPGASQSQGESVDKVKDVNEILDAFKPKPVTRSLRSLRGLKKERPPECGEVLKADGPASRSPAKKEREVLDQCTADNARLDFLIPFALNSSELDPSAQRQLQEIGKALENEALKDIGFVIAGHTDRRGNGDYNLKLSQARAETVRHYLVENFAVAGRRLRPVGFGYERLKVPEDPYADLNRRVELIKAE